MGRRSAALAFILCAIADTAALLRPVAAEVLAAPSEVDGTLR
jgi:hypothetical protein